MCLACMEYMKGKLTDSEFKRNLREYTTEEHDPKALERAEINPTKSEVEEKKNVPRPFKNR